MEQAKPDHAQVLVLPPVLFCALLLIGVLVHWLWPLPLGREADLVRIVGFALLVLGGLLGWSAERALKRRQTNIHPRKPTLAIAREGPYRFTRNPLYLTLIAIFLGIALTLNEGALLLLVLPLAGILHFGVVLREERYLEEKFGEEYTAYKQHTRRWL